MRDANTVYLVSTADFGAHEGATTVTMRLLKGNEVLEVDDVLYVEADGDSLEWAWEDNVGMMKATASDGMRLYAVTDAEADALYERRMGDVEDEASWYEDEDETKVVQEATATGWRLTVEGEEHAVEIVGDMQGGTWHNGRVGGTYERHDEDMRFKDAAGDVVDALRADEECFKRAWLWGLD